jgi:hypothetical protein
VADFRRISEEIVSMEHLDQIFQECQVSARSSALTPIISHSCSSLIKTEKSRRLIEYWTVSDKFQSDRMILSVLDGTELVSRLKRTTEDNPSASSVSIAYSVAKRISMECNSFLLRKPKDRSVLIVHCLFSALDEAAKQVGFQASFKVRADITLTELITCFYYQLTTRKLR